MSCNRRIFGVRKRRGPWVDHASSGNSALDAKLGLARLRAAIRGRSRLPDNPDAFGHHRWADPQAPAEHLLDRIDRSVLHVSYYRERARFRRRQQPCRAQRVDRSSDLDETIILARHSVRSRPFVHAVQWRTDVRSHTGERATALVRSAPGPIFVLVA